MDNASIMDNIATQEIWQLINAYGALVATPGIAPKSIALCNKNIERLLDSIQGRVDKLTAQKAGIITK
jgi:hypothetical protein